MPPYPRRTLTTAHTAADYTDGARGGGWGWGVGCVTPGAGANYHLPLWCEWLPVPGITRDAG